MSSYAHHQQQPTAAAGQQQQQPSAMAYTIAPEPVSSGVRYARDQYGIYYYDGPIPNIDNTATYPFRVWEPHAEYMYFSETGENSNKGQVVYIKPWKGAYWPTRIQCADLSLDQPLRAPFGLRGVTIDPKTGNKMGSNECPNLELSFDNAEALEGYFRKVDNSIKAVASARLAEWFDAEPEMAPLLMRNYKPIVAPPPKPKSGMPDKGYRPTMRTKLSLYGPNEDGTPNKNDTIVWSATPTGGDRTFALRQVTDRGEIDKLLVRNCRVVPIVDIASLWFIKGGLWGVSLRMVEIVVMPSEERQRGVFYGMNIVADDGTTDQHQAHGGSPSAGNGGISPTQAHDYQQQQQQHDNGMPMDVVQGGFAPASSDHFPAFDGHA